MWRGINGIAKRDDVKVFKEFVEAASDMVRYMNDFFECTGRSMNGMTRIQAFEKFLPPAQGDLTREP